MATASERRTRVRPMPIADFCDRFLSTYKHPPPKSRENPQGFYAMRRVTAFVTQHPAMESTADLTTGIIADFTVMLAGYSYSYRGILIREFRRFCNLAVEWGCLERDPFEGYLFHGSPPGAWPPRGPDLDGDKVLRILAYLKSKSETWQGHRLFAFTAVIIHTGLWSDEARKLRSTDCDLDRGMIRIPGRARFYLSGRPPVVEMPPALAEIMAAWLPIRMNRPPRRNLKNRYGTSLADDGRTPIPDDTERRVIADMLRWRDEGWNFNRIAHELNSRGIPGKQGQPKWHWTTVKNILIRESSSASDGGRRGTGPRSDPGWIFPSLCGDGFWSRSSTRGQTPLDQIRAAGKALGIEGLTFEALRQFQVAQSRAGSESAWDRSAEVATPAEGRSVPGPPAGDLAAELAKLSAKQRRVVRALIAAGPGGMIGAEIQSKSGIPSWWKMLRKLRDTGPYWGTRVERH